MRLLARLMMAAAMAHASAAAVTPPIMPTTPMAPPKLMIVIAVDQLSADLFDEYRGQFTGGLAKLARGTVYRNAFQSHATTETCPGHATLITGVHPARNGIIGNEWVDFGAARKDKEIYCAEDERVPGSDSSHYTPSAVHLKVPTLGDMLKRTSPTSRVVAIAEKDRSAVMFGGHSADNAFYWDGKSFVSAGKYPPRASLGPVNAAVAARIGQSSPTLQPPAFCKSKSTSIAIPEHAAVGWGLFERTAGDTKAWRASPEADEATLALGASLVREMALGKGPQTDLLALGLSATDYVGHAFGTEGQEMCLQLLALDQSLGDFFARLDSWGVDYSVVLSADHGGADIPERARLNGVPGAARIDPDLTPAKISAAVRQATVLTGPILADVGVIGDLYLDPSLVGADRARALAEVVKLYSAHPQVEAVLTKDTIAATPIPSGDPTKWSMAQRVRASFDAERSGDLYVILKPNITPIGHATGSVATHGSPWDHDRRVPVVFWRKGAVERTVDTPVESVDVVPTVAAMVGLTIAPDAVDGHCLAEVPGVVCPTQ